MLKDLFGSNASTTQGYRAPSVPVVSRAYEESYMRQPMREDERPCVMGVNCECNFVGNKVGDGFTAVEFPLPSEATHDGSAAESGCSQQQQHQRMCVLCHRRLVQSLFYDIIYSGVCSAPIQHYCCKAEPYLQLTVHLEKQAPRAAASSNGTATYATKRTNMPERSAWYVHRTDPWRACHCPSYRTSATSTL